MSDHQFTIISEQRPGDQLLQKKAHKELLESYESRAHAAEDYTKAVRPALTIQTGALLDPKVTVPLFSVSKSELSSGRPSRDVCCSQELCATSGIGELALTTEILLQRVVC